MSKSSKYFKTTKKGEVRIWKDNLNSLDKEKVKDAVKKVIAAMTVGKDVSTLFPDIIKSMPTTDLELKKLVYLYIINYARTQPEKSILVINTFQKDASSLTANPLIRALAIRTMGCLRVERITEHLCDPLQRALEDEDPYVRKTAAVCVAKLYDMSPNLVTDRGFLGKLREMLSDVSPMVVANAVAALAEISERGQEDIFKINATLLQKLLTALNECTEWGQVFILESLARYEPTEDEASRIIERVTPRLKHSNSALVLSAIKVIMKYLDILDTTSEGKTLARKLTPPLVTLLSAEPEIQYVALRNIDLIVQKRPEILSREVRVFFCKYNDPVYVKMEKLEIMVKLAANSNIEQLLSEFKEYAQEVDVDFVRKSVRAIGRCAIKLERAADRCVKALLDLLETKVNYVVQEAVIVIKDIFRRYPNQYEGTIVNLCQNLDSLDEPEAKASMIWIIGEYAERIEDAAERLEAWIENFVEESNNVQFALLTATVKLFLKLPDKGQGLVRTVLDYATENAENPDLRDRGYVYWRLLSTDPTAAKKLILADKPVIGDDTFKLDKRVLDVLIQNIASLASVYHKPPETFVKGMKTVVFHAADEDEDNDSDESEESEEESEEESAGEEESEEEEAEVESEESEEDKAVSDEEQEVEASEEEDSDEEVEFAVTKRFMLLPKQKGNGLQISATLSRKNGTPVLMFYMENHTAQDFTKFALKFNKNYLGASLVKGMLNLSNKLAGNGGKATSEIPLTLKDPADPASKLGVVQMALKTEVGVLYFSGPLSLHIFFEEEGKIGDKDFISQWKVLSYV